MNYFMAILVPLIFLASFSYALIKKVRLYDSFTEGMKGAFPLIVSIFPYIAAVVMLTKLLDVSGLSAQLAKWISPFFHAVGIPEELCPLFLIKPLSGSGAIAVLSDVLTKYGVDSYIGRCACVAYGSSETIFYVSAVYFSGIKRKKISLALWISVICYILSLILCCWLCNFI